MEIRIDRAWKKRDYTISRVFIDGKRFGDSRNYCNALEDFDRGLTSDMSVDDILSVKVYGKTAIPTGKYSVVLSWSSKFKKILPEVRAVKGFTGIRLHSLNNAEQSQGCIGFGVNDKVGWISNSKYWCNLIQKRISDAISKGEKVYLIVG